MPSADIEPRSVKVPVAAKALGIAVSSCWSEVKAGRLRSFRYGRSVLIPVAALEEWIADREREGAA
jgi:excisionase family DNA binding protein